MWQDAHNNANFNSNLETIQMPMGRKADTHVLVYLRGIPFTFTSSVGKESICNAGDPGSNPGLGRSPGEGISYPLPYSWASLVTQLVKNPYSSEKRLVEATENKKSGPSWHNDMQHTFQYNSNNHWKQKLSLSGMHIYICDKTVLKNKRKWQSKTPNDGYFRVRRTRKRAGENHINVWKDLALEMPLAHGCSLYELTLTVCHDWRILIYLTLCSRDLFGFWMVNCWINACKCEGKDQCLRETIGSWWFEDDV